MLDHISNIQQMADTFKSMVLDADDTAKELRLDVLRTVARFEQFGWHPRVMEQAISEVAPDLAKLTFDPVNETALETISAILVRYIELYGFDQRQNEKLFTMQTAADYLGISRSMMETYVSRRGEIDGEKIGRSWVFTQSNLDRFKKRKRKRGRPAAKDGK